MEGGRSKHKTGDMHKILSILDVSENDDDDGGKIHTHTHTQDINE